MTDADGNPIRANGEDGKDGQDGQDGQDGADGEDGADGSTGPQGPAGISAPTPQIKLGNSITSGTIYGLDGTEQADADDTAWYLSVDNGVTWYRISGEKGDTGETERKGHKANRENKENRARRVIASSPKNR